MKDRLEYEVTEYGDIPGKEDYLSEDFMETCFDEGRTTLVVINYEEDGEQK